MGKINPFWRIFFQMGWNHQPDFAYKAGDRLSKSLWLFFFSSRNTPEFQSKCGVCVICTRRFAVFETMQVCTMYIHTICSLWVSCSTCSNQNQPQSTQTAWGLSSNQKNTNKIQHMKMSFPAHSIQVWYICLQLPLKSTIHAGRYSIHHCYGQGRLGIPLFCCLFLLERWIIRSAT